MTNVKKQDEEKGGTNLIAASIAGAIVGAGIAVAGAVLLKDEKMWEKTKKVLSDVKDQAAGYIDYAKTQAQDTKDEGEQKMIEGKETVKKLAASTNANHKAQVAK